MTTSSGLGHDPGRDSETPTTVAKENILIYSWEQKLRYGIPEEEFLKMQL